MSLFSNEHDEANDDSAMEYTSMSTSDCLILLIDASTTMRDALRGLMRVLLDIFAAKTKYPRDRIGVVFYNTGGLSNPLQFNHIYVWRGLEGSSADIMIALQNIVSKDEMYAEFCQLLDGDGSVGEPADFSQVIWTVIMLFGTIKSKSVERRLFILTNDDDPGQGNKILRSKSQKKLADLCEMDVAISVMPISSPDNADSKFNFHKFYSPFIDEEPENLDGMSFPKRVQDLAYRIAVCTSARRVLASTTFTLDGCGEQTLAIDVFSLRMEAKIPHPAYIDPETNELLTSQSNWIAQDTGELLDDFQVSSYYTYAGKNITISKNDIKTLKSMYPSGLQLLGFKPVVLLADCQNIKPALFLRPNEKRITGSSLIMQALIERTSAREVFIVARMNLRDAQVPRIVALLPQQQQVNEFGDVLFPAGFNCVTLPYADDIREVPDTTVCEMPDLDLIDKAIAICKEFQVEQYTPKMYDNPHLARFNATLKALALNQSEQDPVEDTLTVGEPKASRPLFEQFAQAAFPNGPSSPSTGAATGKRPSNPKPASDPHARRSKRSGPVDISDFETLHARSQLTMLTIAQLKIYLTEYGLPQSGNKAALVDRISKHISSK